MYKNLNTIHDIIHFSKKLNPYSRFLLSNKLNSSIHYGDDNFGNREKLKISKEDYKKALDGKKIMEENNVVISIEDFKRYNPKAYKKSESFIFQEHSRSIENRDNQDLEIIASNKDIRDFLGKNFILDISPTTLFIIFPDLTFKVNIKTLYKIDWKDIRTELQDLEIMEKDISYLSGETISLDKLRRTVKNKDMSDGELTELRKKLYGVALVIDQYISRA